LPTKAEVDRHKSTKLSGVLFLKMVNVFEMLEMEINESRVMASAEYSGSSRGTRSLSNLMKELKNSLTEDPLTLNDYRPVIDLIREGGELTQFNDLQNKIKIIIAPKKEEDILERLEEMQSEFNRLAGGDELLRIKIGLESLKKNQGY